MLIEQRGCSQRLACRLVGMERGSVRYQPRPRTDEANLVERLHEFANKKRRRGYRLIHRELRQEGQAVNHKRIYPLWKQEGLSVPPRKIRKRRRAFEPVRDLAANRSHRIWCLDFVEDCTLSGSKLHIL
jgi:putative transposase